MMPLTQIPLIAERNRAFSDLLEAERRLRAASEKTGRELRQLLIEVAIRLDGPHFEERRRGNPAFPENYSVQDWRTYLQSIAISGMGRWEADVPKTSAREQELDKQTRTQAITIARLTQELEVARQQLAGWQTESERPSVVIRKEIVPAPKMHGIQPVLVRQGSTKAIVPEHTSQLDDMTAAHADLVKDALLVKVADVCPAQWLRQVDPGGGDASRSEANRVKAWSRKQIILYFIGRWGINSRQELESLLRRIESAESTSGSTHRLFDALEKGGLLVSEKFELKSGVSFVMYHLSMDGNRLFRDLFGINPIESDWEKLKRAHEGTRFPEHTVSILIFSVHARRRGWNTQVLPTVEGSAEPDIVIWKGEEKLYCEVELGNKERPAKWRNNAALNNGKVALCAGTQARRATLVGDCKLGARPGVATDIETLVKSSYHKLTGDENLWDQSW